MIQDLDKVLAAYEGLIAEGMSKMDAYRTVGELTGRKPESIAAIIKSLQPTTNLATHLLRARAFQLASKLVREANTEQIIDILERPNIGVLAPKQEAAGQGGFFLSVTADSCGAVKVGAGQTSSLRGLDRPPALPPGREWTQDDRAQRVSDSAQEGTDATREGNQVSDEGWRPLGVQEGRSSGGQEHDIGGDPHAGRVRQGQEDGSGYEVPGLYGRDPQKPLVQEADVNAQVPPVREGGFLVRRASTLRAIEEARARIAAGVCTDQRRKHPGPRAPFTPTQETPAFARPQRSELEKERRRLDQKRRRARVRAEKL